MAIKVKMQKSVLGNWRYVEVDNKGKIIQSGPKHVKGTPELPLDIIAKASSFEQLEDLLKKLSLKSQKTVEILDILEEILNDQVLMDELVSSKKFDIALKRILRNKFEGQTIGQMMDEKEFSEFLNTILDKMMSYTTSLFEHTQTDNERAELEAVTEYLVSTTAGSIMMVEKETFRDANKKLTASYEEANKTFEQQNELLIKNKKTIDQLNADIRILDAEIIEAEKTLASIRSNFDSAMQELAEKQIESRESISRKTGNLKIGATAIKDANKRQNSTIQRLLMRRNASQNNKSLTESQMRGLSQE